MELSERIWTASPGSTTTVPSESSPPAVTDGELLELPAPQADRVARATARVVYPSRVATLCPRLAQGRGRRLPVRFAVLADLSCATGLPSGASSAWVEFVGLFVGSPSIHPKGPVVVSFPRIISIGAVLPLLCGFRRSPPAAEARFGAPRGLLLNDERRGVCRSRSPHLR